MSAASAMRVACPLLVVGFVALAASSCRTTVTPDGAVVLELSIDETADGAFSPPADALAVAVTSADGGRTFWQGTRSIPGQSGSRRHSPSIRTATLGYAWT